MRIATFNCPYCGAAVQPDLTGQPFFCQFCGNEFVLGDRKPKQTPANNKQELTETKNIKNPMFCFIIGTFLPAVAIGIQNTLPKNFFTGCATCTCLIESLILICFGIFKIINRIINT